MCLIVVKYPGSHITRKTLHTAFNINDDGAGFMYAVNNKLYVEKGFFTFRKFYQAFRQAENKHLDKPFVIHFRITTSGNNPYTGCHPHLINRNLAFAHNGILFGLGNKVISDTQQLANIIKQFPSNFLFNDKIVTTLEEYAVAGSNKFVFMDNKSRITIFNELAGHWNNGNWYSNYSYKPIVGATPAAYGNDYYYDNGDHTTKQCCICNRYNKRHNMRPQYCSPEDEKYVCDKCWDTFTTSLTMTCPYCFNDVVLPYNQVCPECGMYLRELDILQYIISLYAGV